jgi:hypothetical protein
LTDEQRAGLTDHLYREHFDQCMQPIGHAVGVRRGGVEPNHQPAWAVPVGGEKFDVGHDAAAPQQQTQDSHQDVGSVGARLQRKRAA